MHDGEARLCTMRGAGDAAHGFAVWANTGSGTSLGNVLGALYDTGWFTSFCFPGLDAASCPCGNPPSMLGRGCGNSSGTGGAVLSAGGEPSIGADSVVFTMAGERPTAASIVLKGNGVTNGGFGQGVRYVGGSLKRLYVKSASGGSISPPGPGDPSVHARSAALGDAFGAAAQRYYMVYYRDPSVLGGRPVTTGRSLALGSRRPKDDSLSPCGDCGVSRRPASH